MSVVRHRSWLAPALLLAAGAVHGELNCNVGIEFYDDGRVRACVLNGNHHIYTESGTPVTCADGERLEEHRDGSLARCTLALPAEIEGRRCAAGGEVAFGDDGHLLRCQEAPTG
jgi:hypothetical protein